MEINQAFKAPSIPKLSKRTISSPFGEKSALSAPKLKKTSFSFIKGIESVPSAILQKPEEKAEEKREGGLSKVLSDTNKIFGQIRDQLVLDFSTRIADAKKSLSKIKEDTYKKRRNLKESLISGVKGIGSGIMGQVTQILAPAKSIFDKIKEFFQIILTGIVLNNAFKWLQDPKNRALIGNVFKFVADHWKELLILFGTYKLIRLLFKIISVAKAIKSFFDLFRKKPPKGGGDCGCDDKNKPKGNGPYDPCAAILNCIKDITGPTAEAFADKIANTSRFRPLFSLLGVTNLKPKPAQTPKPKARFTETEFDKKIREGDKPTPIDEYDPANLIMLFGLLRGRGASTPLGANNILRSASIPGKLSRAASPVARADGGTIKKSVNISSLGFSAGGTVGGRGKPKGDDVPTWLSSGEEVINNASSMLWRPLLKDINENAGRLFDQFRQAVIKLTDITVTQKKTNEIFKNITDEFNNYIKKQIQKKQLENLSTGGGTSRTGGGGSPFGFNPRELFEKAGETYGRQKGRETGIPGGGWWGGQQGRNKGGEIYDNTLGKFLPSGTSNLRISSPQNPRSIPSSISKSSGGRPIIVPMNLPPIVGKMPEIKTPTATSSEVPNISSVNMANPYMQITSKIYGIHVI